MRRPKAKNIIVAIVIAFIGYPVLMWLIIDGCTGRIGVVDNRIVCSYQSVHDSSKHIHLKRFISIEYFKYPFVNYKRFEFYVLEPSDTNMIFQLQTDSETIILDRLNKVKNVPNQIRSLNKDGVVLHVFKIIHRDVNLLNNPSPLYNSMLVFGPTITDRFGICD
jgi:hypothetical protein